MNWKKHKLPALLMLMIVVYSCASMGTPDGGCLLYTSDAADE